MAVTSFNAFVDIIDTGAPFVKTLAGICVPSWIRNKFVLEFSQKNARASRYYTLLKY